MKKINSDNNVKLRLTMLKLGKIISITILFSWVSVVEANERGTVTNLPIPRFVSMKVSEGFVRRGPSKLHRIDCVYKHRNTPLMVTGEYEHWRRVQDVDGQGGWMHFRLLSGTRTVVFKSEKSPVKRRNYEGADTVFFAEKGVIGNLDECNPNWCKVYVNKKKGWVLKSHIWGVFENELRN